MNTFSFVSSAAKYGLYLGLGLCLYTTVMWLTKLDTAYLAFGQYLDIAITALPIGIVFAAVYQQRKRARVGVWQRVAIAIGIGIVAQLIYAPFLHYYHTRLNPEWFTYVLQVKQAQLTAAGSSATAIAQELARMQAAQQQRQGMFSGFWASAVVLPVPLALLTLPFIRNRTAAASSSNAV